MVSLVVDVLPKINVVLRIDAQSAEALFEPSFIFFQCPICHGEYSIKPLCPICDSRELLVEKSQYIKKSTYPVKCKNCGAEYYPEKHGHMFRLDKGLLKKETITSPPSILCEKCNSRWSVNFTERRITDQSGQSMEITEIFRNMVERLETTPIQPPLITRENEIAYLYDQARYIRERTTKAGYLSLTNQRLLFVSDKPLNLDLSTMSSFSVKHTLREARLAVTCKNQVHTFSVKEPMKWGIYLLRIFSTRR